MFKFKYKDFYRKVIRNLDNDNYFERMGDMDVVIYDALEKYDTKSQNYQKFCVTNIMNIRKVNDISDNYEDIYPYGLFVVPDYTNSWRP